MVLQETMSNFAPSSVPRQNKNESALLELLEPRGLHVVPGLVLDLPLPVDAVVDGHDECEHRLVFLTTRCHPPTPA